MARYLGAACKATRRIGTDLGLKRRGGRDIDTKCKIAVPPGQHGAKRTRSTDYGLMLKAKQMLKLMYGVLERQFRRYYAEASRRQGARRGDNMKIVMATSLIQFKTFNHNKYSFLLC